jgi:hypothetical protein
VSETLVEHTIRIVGFELFVLFMILSVMIQHDLLIDQRLVVLGIKVVDLEIKVESLDFWGYWLILLKM